MIDFGRSGAAMVDAVDRRVISYRELGGWVRTDRQLLNALPRPGVVFQFTGNSPAAVASYLACLGERLPLGLGEPDPELRSRVINVYKPTAVVLPKGDTASDEYTASCNLAGGDLVLWVRKTGAYSVVPHPDLALLLATSGSTGDAKFVRLSRANLTANAKSIAAYLALGTEENAIQSLPFYYSYGLSILNSHLAAGAALTLTPHSFMRPEFWSAVDEFRCTSFAGVPYMYETLNRLKISPAARPSIRTITQAGGHLRVDLVKQLHDAIDRKGGRLFVMYGQTEATARMSYLPPARLAEKAGSIGIAIPNGRFWLEPAEDAPTQHQLYYQGPNVMMGYATVPADLARGDEMGGVLPTGDLAECDGEGFFRITGRLARFAKLFGKRINLASVESEIEVRFPNRAACIDGGDSLRIVLERADRQDTDAVRSHLAALLGVPPLAIKVTVVDQLPLTSSGKKDYKALK
jgi:acyl-CoA synthetase (AMP-forming)/AMP-acid ligase II